MSAERMFAAALADAVAQARRGNTVAVQRGRMQRATEAQLHALCKALQQRNGGIERLSLGFNGLAVLPQSLGALTSLTTLNLAHNALSALPPSLVRLRFLTDLDLRGNALGQLPDWLGGLKRLRKPRMLNTGGA